MRPLESLIVLHNTLPVINRLNIDVLIKSWQRDKRQLPYNTRAPDKRSSVLSRIEASGKSNCILVQGDQTLSHG